MSEIVNVIMNELVSRHAEWYAMWADFVTEKMILTLKMPRKNAPENVVY